MPRLAATLLANWTDPTSRYQSLIWTGVSFFFFDGSDAGAIADSSWFEATAADARSAGRGRGNGDE